MLPKMSWQPLPLSTCFTLNTAEHTWHPFHPHHSLQAREAYFLLISEETEVQGYENIKVTEQVRELECEPRPIEFRWCDFTVLNVGAVWTWATTLLSQALLSEAPSLTYPQFLDTKNAWHHIGVKNGTSSRYIFGFKFLEEATLFL